MPAKAKVAKKAEEGASPKKPVVKKPVDKKKKAERELKKLEISDKWKAEGKDRDKIGVRRFSLGKQKPAAVPPPVIKKGKGSKLKNIAHIEAQIKRRAIKDLGLTTLHRLVLGKVGKHTEVKDNLRAFSGVVYDDEEGGLTKEKLEGKLEDLKLAVLKDVAKVLCVDPAGKREDLLERVIEMLEKPKESDYSPRKRAASPGKKSPSKKHKGERTRPLSGYIFFCKDKRPELSKDHPDEPVTEISKRLGKLWKKLSEKEKAPYEAKSKADKKRLAKASPKKKSPAKKSPKKEERSESESEEAGSGSD